MKKLLWIILLLFALAPVLALANGADDFIVSDTEEETDREYFWARLLMQEMTLEEKAAQLFIVSPEMLSGEEYTVDFGDQWRENLRHYPVGGIALFGQNIVSDEQLKKLNQDLQAAAAENNGISLFLVAEEEGGKVGRIGQKLGLEMLPAASELAHEQEAFQQGQNLGKRISEYGFNMNLAPLADVLIYPGSELAGRSFGESASHVAGMASAMMRGLHSEGIVSVLRHFPGHGAVEGNLHNGVNNMLRTLEEMRLAEFVPYRQCIQEGLGAVQVSNLMARKLDDELPAAFSKTVVNDVLRNELGFEGVVITDSLRQRFVTAEYTPGQAAVAAIQAGCDMLYMPEDFYQAHAAIVAAVRQGEISEARLDESVSRILMLKIQFGLIQ